jgi:hypothetical protein
MRIRNKVWNTPDIKDNHGWWIEAYNPFLDTTYITCAGRYWGAIVSRCTAGGHAQRSRPTYKGCVNEFEDFQHFADWATIQVGYAGQESSGKYWPIDKELLRKGNKIYSPEHCVFLPQEVNATLVNRKRSNTGLPLGVFYDPRYGTYCGRCSVEGKPVHCGTFGTAEAAFAAYKRFKEDRVKELAEKWKDKISPKAYAALHAYRQEITD